MREYTFNDLRAHLSQLRLEGGSPFLRGEDSVHVMGLLALVGSLTEEERLDPELVLSSGSRWKRAENGSGGPGLSRHRMRRWLRLMSAIVNEVR
jgi:signal recognition particle GTPase